MNISRPTSCGICEQYVREGERRIWHNHLTGFAHPICLQWIQKENEAIQRILDDYFPKKGAYRNTAQHCIINAIKEKIGSDSILDYKRETGDGLFNLIQSEEVKAIAKRYQDLMQERFVFFKNSDEAVYF